MGEKRERVREREKKSDVLVPVDEINVVVVVVVVRGAEGVAEVVLLCFVPSKKEGGGREVSLGRKTKVVANPLRKQPKKAEEETYDVIELVLNGIVRLFGDQGSVDVDWLRTKTKKRREGEKE